MREEVRRLQSGDFLRIPNGRGNKGKPLFNVIGLDKGPAYGIVIGSDTSQGAVDGVFMVVKRDSTGRDFALFAHAKIPSNAVPFSEDDMRQKDIPSSIRVALQMARLAMKYHHYWTSFGRAKED